MSIKLNLTKPKKLQLGDTVGIVAPSAGSASIFPHRVETAIKTLSGLGYKVKFAKNALGKNDHVSASPKKRADDLHQMFVDKDIKAIICTTGGDHSNQILKHLDFKLISENPKIFLGYSDISVLHYALNKKANLETFYGPCLMTQFGEYPFVLPYTLDYFNKAVARDGAIGEIFPSTDWTAEILDWTTKKDLERPRKLLKSEGYEWLREGSSTAPIIGGCVPSINHIIGTEYWVNPDKKIFFIDIPEGYDFGKGLPVNSLDSYLADLDNSDVFKNISGLIVGRPYNYTKKDCSKLKEIINYYTSDYNYPVLLNANIGHCDPIITIPLGIMTTLNSSAKTFSINDSAVC